MTAAQKKVYIKSVYLNKQTRVNKLQPTLSNNQQQSTTINNNLEWKEFTKGIQYNQNNYLMYYESIFQQNVVLATRICKHDIHIFDVQKEVHYDVHNAVQGDFRDAEQH